jgi:hypothetical protein
LLQGKRHDLGEHHNQDLGSEGKDKGVLECFAESWILQNAFEVFQSDKG